MGQPINKIRSKEKHDWPSHKTIEQLIKDIGLNPAARKLGIPKSTLHFHCMKYGIPTKRSDSPPDFVLQYEASHRTQAYDTLYVEPKGKITVTADWHVPVCAYDYIDKMIAHSKSVNSTELAIIGDFFNLDSLSRFDWKQDVSYAENKNPSFLPEVQRANALVKYLLKSFRKIYFTMGNHDLRYMHTLGYRLPFSYSLLMLLSELTESERNRIVITNFDSLVIKTKNGNDWLCAHTNQYSRMPLKVPCDLAEKHNTNFAGAHRHHYAVGRSSSGHLAVELGGLFDPTATQYLRSYENTMPEWNQGFMILNSKDGSVELPGLTISLKR